MQKSEIFWQTYLNLEKELIEVSKYIYVTDEKIVNNVSQNCTTQLETFSPHIADLIIRTCIEIESISKELYFDLGGPKHRGDKNLYFDQDCLKLIENKCHTDNKVVLVTCLSFNLTKEENRSFLPLKKAYKCQGTDWEKSYQALKHDRYASINKATIKNLIHALGALYLLNVYYKDMKFSSKFFNVSNLDLSLGSTVFSLKMPSQKYLIDVVNGIEYNDFLMSDDSPFILKYTDSVYRDIIEANKQCNKSRRELLLSQPEWSDFEFIRIVDEGIQKEKDNPHERFIASWALFKYRLNKRMPNSLSFEERKELFIKSNEWKGKIRMQNHHLSEHELTDLNIQSEIDKAGEYAGMEFDQQFESVRFQKTFTDGYCELVLDKGNIKYT